MLEKPFELSSGVVELLKWALPLALSVFALWKSTRDRQRAERESSNRARQQYNGDLRRWSNDGISVLADAIQIARQKELDQGKLGEVISRLSALSDQGRLFFPNLHPTLHGQDKETANQGFRPRILDWLIFSFRLCCLIRETPDLDVSSALASMKRGFTSDAQLAIDPLNLFTTMTELQERLKDGAFMDISQSHPNIRKVRVLIEERKARAIHLPSPDTPVQS